MKRYPWTLAIALTLVGTAQAHFIWLEFPSAEPDTVHMRFAEAPLEKTNAKLQELSAPMVVKSPDGKTIGFEAAEDFRTGLVPSEESLVLGDLVYGLMDRRESGGELYLLQYHAKGARNLESAAAAADLPVDIRATIADDVLTVRVYFQGKPFAGSELVLDLPNAPEQIKGTTDEAGVAQFPIEIGGWVGIRAMVSETASGTHEGTEYEQVRHYGTLTFPHPDR